VKPVLLAALALALVTTSLACTHQYQMMATRPFQPLPARLQSSRARVVAVIFDDRHVRPVYETSTDGHTFVFHGAQPMIAGALNSALQGNVAAVRAVNGGPPNSNFDVQLIPELSIDASGMLSHRCTVRFALSVANARGQTVARRESEAVETFVPIDLAPEACDLAFTTAFNKVAYEALPAIDGVR
jgi:hypothetical protein